MKPWLPTRNTCQRLENQRSLGSNEYNKTKSLWGEHSYDLSFPTFCKVSKVTSEHSEPRTLRSDVLDEAFLL